MSIWRSIRPISRSASAYTILPSCSVAVPHVNTLKSFSICWGGVIVFVYLHFIYIVGWERCSGKTDWIHHFYTRKWTKQHKCGLIGNMFCVFIRHLLFVHQMHGSITFRNGGSISYEWLHLHYLRTSRERSRDSLQVLTSFEILCRRKEGFGTPSFLSWIHPCIVSLQMHIFQAELHWSPIVPCRENEYVRQEQIYQEIVVLLCCQSLCFSQKYLLCVVVNPFDSKWKMK